MAFGPVLLPKKTGTEGKVIAFEPLSTNRSRLLKNADLNNSTIDVRDLALSDECGSDTISVSEDKIGAAMGSLVKGAKNSKKIDISMKQGETVDAPPPSVIKIDVEGAELSVLNGMGNKLDSCRVIYVEIHPEFLPDRHSPDDVKKFLVNNGYSIEILSERESTNTYIIRAYHV